MTSELVVPDWAVFLSLLCLVGLAVAVVALARSVRRSRRRAQEVLSAAAADVEELRAQLLQLEERLAEDAAQPSVPASGITVVDDREYVITGLGERRPRVAVPVVPAPVFADILLRESLVRTASLAAGLRRALSPQVRHRIRFEMKREVKRSRKQRKADVRQARREWETRQRAVPVGADPA